MGWVRHRPPAAPCGLLRSLAELPGTVSRGRWLAWHTVHAPGFGSEHRAMRTTLGGFSVSWQVRPGVAPAQPGEPRPLLFFGAGLARYHVRVGAFAQYLVRERHAAGGLVKGEVTGDCSVTNIGGRDLIGALLRHKTDESIRPGSDRVAGLPRRSVDCTAGIGGKDSGGNRIGMAFGRGGLGPGVGRFTQEKISGTPKAMW